MCSILNDSRLIQETFPTTTMERKTTTVTSEKDHNFKQRKRQRLDMTTSQLRTQHANYDTENNNNNMENNSRKTFPKRVNLCAAIWCVALTAIFLNILAGLPHAVAAEKLQTVDRRDLSSIFLEDSESLVADSEKYNTKFNIQTVDRRDFSSSLKEDSENLVADSEKYNINFNNSHNRKKRAKSKSLTFLDYIEKLHRQQSPFSQRKRRKRSVREEDAVSEGRPTVIIFVTFVIRLIDWFPVLARFYLAYSINPILFSIKFVDQRTRENRDSGE